MTFNSLWDIMGTMKGVNMLEKYLNKDNPDHLKHLIEFGFSNSEKHLLVVGKNRDGDGYYIQIYEIDNGKDYRKIIINAHVDYLDLRNFQNESSE